MTELVRTAAFAASQALLHLTKKPQRSHLSEICATLLGYSTLAALQVEEADAALALHLDDADILVVDVRRGRERALSLLSGYSDQELSSLVEACAIAIKGAVDPKSVYLGIEDF